MQCQLPLPISPEFGSAEQISLRESAVRIVNAHTKTQLHKSVAGPPPANAGEKSTAENQNLVTSLDIACRKICVAPITPVRLVTEERIQKQIAVLYGQGSSLGRPWRYPSSSSLVCPVCWKLLLLETGRAIGFKIPHLSAAHSRLSAFNKLGLIRKHVGSAAGKAS